MKTKKTEYLDMKTLKPAYGIKVQHAGKWHDLAIDGVLYTAKTEKECEAKRAEIKAWERKKANMPKDSQSSKGGA